MKRVLMTAAVAVALMGITTNAGAQKGFNLSVKGTPQFTWLQNEDDSDNSQLDRKATFKTNFGIGAGYHFTKNYGVGLDVLYSLQGQKYEVNGAELTQKLDYLKVPVYFTYNTDPSKKVSFVGKLGPQVSFLTNAKLEGVDGNELDNKEVYNDVTVGGMANAGVQFRLSTNLFLQTGLYFDYDFTNAEDEDYVDYNNGRASTHNMGAGVQVGLKYQL